ncbi:MAG: putative Ig domain-containing protein [Nitrospiraceae bacterium]|nr:putative Ig domain-containing protein [Nitrospiraceae bacterium]
MEELSDKIKSLTAVLRGLRKKGVLLPALAVACALGAIVLMVFAFRSGENATDQTAATAVQKQETVPAASANSSQAASGGYAIEIIPQRAYRNSKLHVICQGFNAPGIANITWYVNGIERPVSTPNEFDTSGALKGDVVQAVAKINGVEVKSGPVTVEDAPPEVRSVKLMPEVFKPGDNKLYVDAAADSGAEIVYEWTVNGTPAGNKSRLDMPVKRNDEIKVRITACNGQDCGQPVILERKIANMPPMFSPRVEMSFNGTEYVGQANATDPDGDTLTYSLESAPRGMTIDPARGLITWKAPPGLKDDTTVTVLASDGHGGVSRFTFTIKPF